MMATQWFFLLMMPSRVRRMAPRNRDAFDGNSDSLGEPYHGYLRSPGARLIASIYCTRKNYHGGCKNITIKDIRVMSRARPTDKQRLVAMLQKRGEVVAVTGDGTNDAPALHYAHVGLSLGSGTSGRIGSAMAAMACS